MKNRYQRILMMPFLLFLLMTACSGKDEKHDYSDAIANYLDQKISINLSEADRLVIIPLNACSPCVKTTLEDLLYLDAESQDFKVLLSGTSIESEIRSLSLEVATKFNCLIDESESLRLYRTNISNPVFVKTNNEYVTNVINLDDKFLSDVLN